MKAVSKQPISRTNLRRSQARMIALQALCAYEALGEGFGEQLHDFIRDRETLADLELDGPAHPELVRFASELARGAWSQRQTLDERISCTAKHWSLHRMPPVDRNILRLGVHELLEHPSTPPPVVVSEAVALAKRFGDADSSTFVNGVLDAIRRGEQADVSASTTVGGATLVSEVESSSSEHGEDQLATESQPQNVVE